MGSSCSGEQVLKHRVTYLTNEVPRSETYKQYSARSIRFDDLAVNRKNQNTYVFTLQVKQEGDISVELAVLNERIHCITSQNYNLQLTHKMVIDIFNTHEQFSKVDASGAQIDSFDASYSSTLMDCKNQKSGQQFSMKIYPFRGYESYTFKKGLYQIWLHRKIQRKNKLANQHIIKLLDAYVFGISQSRQALVFLFEKVNTSLANIAEYRLNASWPWSVEQKYTTITHLLESYAVLNNTNIYHRNLRPSTVFFSPIHGKFLIGNLANARHNTTSANRIREQNSIGTGDDELMTVYGVPFFAEDKVKGLIERNQDIGLYNGLKADYEGIRSILNILETCNIFDRSPQIADQDFLKLNRMLTTGERFDTIIHFIRQRVKNNSKMNIDVLTNDREIARSASYLLAHTHRNRIDEYIFQTTYNLGYNKQFSDMAHQRLDLNSQNQKQLQNAYILKRLAEFYEENGGKGTEYYYNSFILFVKRAEKQLKYGRKDKAQQELQQAQSVFLNMNQKVETTNAKIQLDRVRSLIQLEKGEKDEALKTIERTIVQAAKQQLQLQAQAKMIYTLSKILRKNRKKEQAQQRLKYGLGICGNASDFKSPSSCRIHKSNFLYEIGSLNLDQIAYRHNPHKHTSQQVYPQELKGYAQSHLKSALEIREQQNCDDVEVAECLIELGHFYYLDEDFFEAKRSFRRGLIRLKNLQPEISPIKVADTSYMFGSCCYYLKEYQDAKRAFEDSISILEKTPKQYLLKWNIEGNLGLAMIQLGIENDGKRTLMDALQKIKRQKGDKSYDYACLMKNYLQIKNGAE